MGAYWAALSFTDENIGNVVAAMKEHGFWQNTIVVLWGDHGYQIGENDQWKNVAYSQITRGALVNGMHANKPEEVYMGYSVRTPSWRYTEWVKFDNKTGIADFSKLYGRELYAEEVGENCRFDQDHVNVVTDPSNAG